jgi:hypothetical protein
MKKYLSLIAASVLTIAAIAQSQTKPGEEIIINKEFDEQGNLLRYDSTYTFMWQSDTTFRFPGFEEWEDIFQNQSPWHDLFSGDLFADSTLTEMPFFRDFPPHFFEDDQSPHPFRFDFGFPDSARFRNFSFQMDTTFFMGPDSSFLLPPGFFMPNMNSLRELLKEFRSGPGSEVPFSRFFWQPPHGFHSEPPRGGEVPPGKFPDVEKRREWEKLMEKHRREMEELFRKWEKSEQNKIH